MYIIIIRKDDDFEFLTKVTDIVAAVFKNFDWGKNNEELPTYRKILFDASFRKLFTLFTHPWLGYPETSLI